MSALAPRRPLLAAVGAVLFALIASLVVCGVLTGVDQYAVTHLMPWLRPRHHALITLHGLTLPSLEGPAGNRALELWTYPAAVVPSLVLVVAGTRTLPRRTAAAWCLVWVAGNAVEVIGKTTLARPALERGHVHLPAFDDSLPSGHTIRALVVAGALACAWRYGRLAIVWAAGVPFALVAVGAHTPTDVVAGLFVALALAGWAPLRLARGNDRVGGRVVTRGDDRSGDSPGAEAGDWVARQLGPDWVEVEPGIFQPPDDAHDAVPERRGPQPVADEPDDEPKAPPPVEPPPRRRGWWRRGGR